MGIPRAPRFRIRRFELKIVGVLLLALGITWAAAVYLFDAGVASSFGLILQPSIGEGLETAKDRTHDHIEALREQLKWRTERIASEIRQRGPEARLPNVLGGLLARWLEDDAAAFEVPGGRPGDGSASGGAAPKSEPPRGILIDLSALDATGRRVHVLRPGRFPEAAWRLKTFRPRVPTERAGAEAVVDAVRAAVFCMAGGCRTAPERFAALVETARSVASLGDPPGEAAVSLDAAGLEAVFATPWGLFHGLQSLGDVLDRYKMLRAGGEEIRRRYVWVYMILLGVVFVLTLAVSVLFARRVTRRLDAIAMATRAVAVGDLDVRIPTRGRDEIAALARSFNDMVSELRESRDRISYLQRVSAWQGLARRLAHEIKNPLTPIQLAIQEVSEKYSGNDEAYRRIVATAREVIEEEVATLRRMTTEFSEFARLPKVEPADAELGDFIDDCSAAFGPSASDAGIRIDWRRPSAPVMVAIDRQMMRRVLDNLVRNAVEAISGSRGAGVEAAGGVLVEHRIEVRAGIAEGGRWAEIVVRDDGPGISPDVRDHLFEPHFTTKATGTGLGLAIAKKIVLEHGGEILVAPSTRGASLRITLPLSSSGDGSGSRRGTAG